MYLDNVDELKFEENITNEDYIQTHLSDIEKDKINEVT